MSDRILYESIDRMDGVLSLFLVVGDLMYVCARLAGPVEDHDWYDKDCLLAGYGSEPVDYSRMVDPVEVWK